MGDRDGDGDGDENGWEMDQWRGMGRRRGER